MKAATQNNRHLECVDVAETILHVAVNDKLRQSQNLTTQVKRVAEPRLLSLLSTSQSATIQVRSQVRRTTHLTDINRKDQQTSFIRFIEQLVHPGMPIKCQLILVHISSFIGLFGTLRYHNHWQHLTFL